jgi:short chain dehydrogenase
VVTELFRDWAGPLSGPAGDVIYWYFREVPKLTDAVGVAKAESAPRQLTEATEMAGLLAGKVCVITGTGRSMGRAAALTSAREGASVVGCDVTVEPAEDIVAMVHAAGGTMVSLQP